MIEITKECIVAFMKARNPLTVWCREKKKTKNGENVFFKMDNLLSNGLQEKVMICYIIIWYF